MEKNNHPVPGRFLFISGCPRSGTTVTATLLNWNDDVLVTQERYAPMFRERPHELLPELFTQERMADFRKGESGYTGFESMKEHTAHYANPKDFSAIASYPIRGDKITHLYRNLHVFDLDAWRGRDITIVHVIRNPVMVAYSFETRRQDSSDGWDRDYNEGIAEWVAAINAIHDFREALPEYIRLGIVDYESFFEHGLQGLSNSVERLYRFVGIDFTGQQAKGIEVIHKASSFFEDRRRMHVGVEERVRDRISPLVWRRYEALRHQCV